MSMYDELTVSVIEQGGVVIISLLGNLGITTSDKLGPLVSEMTDAGKTTIVIDLAGIAYIASVGLGALTLAYHQLDEAGGRLVICSPQPKVREVLLLTRIQTIISIFDCREDALAYVG